MGLPVTSAKRRRKKKSFPWPPPDTRTPNPVKDGRRLRRDGEPHQIELELEGPDRALRGDERVSCCDCGLIHFYTYEIYTHPPDNERWFLNRRAYRLPFGKRSTRKKK